MAEHLCESPKGREGLGPAASGDHYVRLEKCRCFIERGDERKSLYQLKSLEPPTVCERRLCAFLQRGLESSSQPESLGVGPTIEHGLTDVEPVEEFAAVELRSRCHILA